MRDIDAILLDIYIDISIVKELHAANYDDPFSPSLMLLTEEYYVKKAVFMFAGL